MSKVFLVNEYVDGYDSVSKVFATEEKAEMYAEGLRVENEAEYDENIVTVVEMEVE